MSTGQDKSVVFNGTLNLRKHVVDVDYSEIQLNTSDKITLVKNWTLHEHEYNTCHFFFVLFDDPNDLLHVDNSRTRTNMISEVQSSLPVITGNIVARDSWNNNDSSDLSLRA